MSTTDSASANPGTQEGAEVAHLSLPTFAPVQSDRARRESRAESSTSGSKWSVGNRRSRSPSNSAASFAGADGDIEDHGRPAPNSLPRRNPNRSSGGFLLEPTTHSSRLSRAILSRSQKDTKGKRKSEQFEISVPKRRNQQPSLDQDQQRQGSSLSTELRREKSGQRGIGDGDSGRNSTTQDRMSLQNGFAETPISQRSVAPSVGFDSDPAQIVEMALKLSEGRRRQASGKRFVSGEVQGKRLISTTASHQLRTPTKTLSQYVASPALASGSPLPDTSLLNGTNEEGNEPMQIDDPFSSPTLKRHVSGVEKGVEISRATAARVEKAKIYLELAYEHRRLLSHLPPIKSPARHEKSPDSSPDSKTYNPLQYARNRKLRLREKSTINAENDGWHDIEKVRAWVDAVIGSHTETRHDPLECVRLPPLSLKEDDEDDPAELQASPKSIKQQPTKPRRPKSDWVTHPGDLIADAFWLEQGLNKTKIQDRDNGSIYPPNTPFKFSGWRNRTPVNIPERLHQLTPPPEDDVREEKAFPLASAPQLPTFKSAHKKDNNDSRNRKGSKIKTPLPKAQNNRRRQKTALVQSSSDSDSESDTSAKGSLKEDTSRGRKLTSREFDLLDGDPFQPPVSSLPQRLNSKGDGNQSETSLPIQHSKRGSIDNSRLMNYLKRNATTKTSSHERGRSRGDAKGHSLFRLSKDVGNDEKQTRSSFDDSSVPGDSPVNYGMPSIAINLDAPISRSPSPTKKSRHSLLHTLKDRSKQSVRDKVETTDFAKQHESSHSRGTSVDAGKANDSPTQTSRGTSPHTRGPSPFTRLRRESTHKEDLPASPIDKQVSSISRSHTRPWSIQLQEPSRIRGIFKGGRIAELVGNEVSRVGDFIWKRDIPPAYRHQMSESEASFRTYDSSATDEDTQNGYVYKKPARDARGSASTLSSTGARQSHESPRSSEKQQLNNPNLPSFTSPFQRDRERQDKQQDLLAPGSDDHISRQAAHHRSASKDPRLDRSALPKLDTGAPRSVGLIERRNSYGFGTELRRGQSASRSYNDLINAKPGNNVSATSSAVGLSGRLRQSVADSIQADGSRSIDKHDIPRLRSLLLISAVKAKNITTVYEQVPTEPSKILLDTISRTNDSPNASTMVHVRKRDEHILAARNLIAHLTGQTDKINNQLHMFTDTSVGRLHQRIQELEDQIEDTITPQVRTAADNAGELSVKLTTTSTQAVKSLQDMISEAFRLRRRGPSRWARLLWFRIVEMSVVGLLWFIWAIVSVIRIFIGVSRAFRKTTRWLLWID